ncbi:MAG: glycosyltransferase, partial [Planctomycetota bacterium]
MDDAPIRPPLTMSLTSHEVELSVIVPLYEEEANVGALYERLRAAVDALGRTYELVFINDGSTDRTGALIDALAEADDRVV